MKDNLAGQRSPAAGLDGLSVFDLLDLSPAQTALLRLIIRKTQVSYADLCAWADALPASERLRRDELDQALAELIQRNQISRSEQGGQPVYRIKFRRRATRDWVTPRRATGKLVNRNLLDVIAEVQAASQEKPAQPAPAATQSASLPATRQGLESSKLWNYVQGQLKNWRMALPLMLLFALNTTVLGIVDVVAMSGFVSDVGVAQLPWVWILDQALVFIGSTGLAVMIDRVPRHKLAGWLLAGFAGCYILVQILFALNAPAWLLYTLVYVLSSQQVASFSMVFWTMANDLHSTAESKRIFPLVAAGETFGQILGYALSAVLAALPFTANISDVYLLSLVIGLFLLSLALVRLVFSKQTIRARQAAPGKLELRETVQVGLDVIRNVPVFRYLAIVTLLGWVAITCIYFHFILAADQAAITGQVDFGAFYSLYNIALIGITLFVQSALAGKWLEQVHLKDAFLASPAANLLGVLCAAAITGLFGAAGATFINSLVYNAWDSPARQLLEGLVPDERRGRVTTILENYTSSIGIILGSLLLGLLAWLAPTMPSPQVMTIIYLATAALAGLGGLWASLRLRATYETSMLNWRISRARRKSVLDGIEF